MSYISTIEVDMEIYLSRYKDRLVTMKDMQDIFVEGARFGMRADDKNDTPSVEFVIHYDHKKVVR